MTPQSLSGISCSSQSDCWTVGSAWNADNVYQTLTEHWNGSSWAVVPSANLNTTDAHRLVDVSCASGSDCWAVGRRTVGTSTNHPLIEHWDGSAWAVVPSPDPAGSPRLTGVTCVSSNDCWAVGYYSSSGGLTEHWDGSMWSIVASPSVGSGSQLLGVLCTSAANCWAVGYYWNGSAYQTLAEKWNGASWTIVVSPNTDPNRSNFLYGVACSSSANCWTVGSSLTDGPDATLAQHWDGNSWTIVSSPNDAVESSQLRSVTCVSSSDCWAVGSTYTIGYTFNDSAFIEHWNGVSWSIAATPPGATGDDDFLSSVTCTSGSHCWAAGQIDLNTPVIEEWNGAFWSRVQAPRIDGPGVDNYLFDTACVSATDCWAVGYSGTILFTTQPDFGPPDFTLIQHWDGNSWSVVPSSNANDPFWNQNILRGVTCVSSTDCWAVGLKGFKVDGETVDYEILIQHWDGSRWSIVSSPNPADADNSSLLKVACSSTSDCWAIGYYYDNNPGIAHTLVEHWNGAAWSIVADATPQNHDHYLRDVACNSASDCWAVGSFPMEDSEGYHSETLFEHWNGTAWSIVDPPDGLVSDSANYAQTITCNSTSDCWATGFFESKANGPTEFARWNGSQWSTFSGPFGGHKVYGLACASSEDCWAVGTDFTADQRQPFTEHWDGIAWSVVPSPTVNSILYYENELDAVACSPGSRCSAVGFYAVHDPETGFQYRTLAEEFTPIPALTSVASRKMHGAAPFDLALPGGGTGIECRSGGPSGDYTVVFSFANSIANVGAASVTAGTGSIAGSAIGSDPHQFLVNLTGVTNAQHLTVTLNNARDSAGDIGSAISRTFSVLIADTNGDGSVNSADISQTKSQSGQSLTNANFREDLNADGSINSGDISLAKSKSGTALPTQPFRAAQSER